MTGVICEFPQSQIIHNAYDDSSLYQVVCLCILKCNGAITSHVNEEKQSSIEDLLNTNDPVTVIPIHHLYTHILTAVQTFTM